MSRITNDLLKAEINKVVLALDTARDEQTVIFLLGKKKGLEIALIISETVTKYE